jgi:hypothetical protein
LPLPYPRNQQALLFSLPKEQTPLAATKDKVGGFRGT